MNNLGVTLVIAIRYKLRFESNCFQYIGGLKHELPTREPSRKGRRKVFSPDLSVQMPCASFNYLENSFERFSSSCRVSVTTFILFM